MKGALIGAVFGFVFVFVLWCIYEAVVEYRYERDLRKFEAEHTSTMTWGWGMWGWGMWRRHHKGYVPPLFHEQRRHDV